MALRMVSDVFSLAWRHPFVCIGILALFTPPFFPIIKFFSPLLISTGVFVVAVVSLGPSSKQQEVPESDGWAFPKAPDVRLWEDKAVQEQERKPQSSATERSRAGKESGWLDWVKNVEATGLAWVDQKLKNEDWKVPLLDDRNVSILQEAFGQRKQQQPEPVAEAFKTDATAVKEERSVPPLHSQERIAKELPAGDEATAEGDVVEEVTCNPDESLSEDAAPDASEGKPVEEAAPDAEGKSVVEEVPSSVVDEHSALPAVVLPEKSLVREASVVSSSSVDLDEGALVEEVQRRVLSSLSMVSRSSDAGSPAAQRPMSTSEKISVIESLADAIEAQENNEPTQEAKLKASLVIKALRPSTSDKVTNIIEKLKGFVEEGVPSSRAAPSPLIKPTPPTSPPPPPRRSSSKDTNNNKKKVLGSSVEEDSSSDDEVMSDSGSDSEFQIFPQLKPAEMKIHPPVKLDVQRVEYKAKHNKADI